MNETENCDWLLNQLNGQFWLDPFIGKHRLCLWDVLHTVILLDFETKWFNVCQGLIGSHPRFSDEWLGCMLHGEKWRVEGLSGRDHGSNMCPWTCYHSAK